MLKQLIYLIFFLLLTACASQSPLTGGDKDNIPPKLVFANPPDKSTQIKPHQIEFQFDEFIQLRSLQQKLVVSPPLKHSIQTKQKPKGFVLLINDTLLNETTYQFYFADAIVDLNEGNPLTGFTYVFSTGNQLDSLSISGTIKDAYTHKPEADFTICLYTDTTDSVVLKKNPLYITRTDNDGRFRLNYLKPGLYKLVAFNDKNNNYRWDATTEKIAFSNQLINIQRSIDTIKLVSFQENRNRQFIKKTERKKPYQASFIFNQPAPAKPAIVHSTVPIYQTVYSAQYDTLTVFFADSTQYTKDTIHIIIQYSYYDSLWQVKTKTDEKLLILEQVKTKGTTQPKASYKLSVNKNQTITTKNNLKITFSEPYHLEKSECKLLLFVKDTVSAVVPLRIVQQEENPLSYLLDVSLLDGRRYRLILNFSHQTPYGQSFNNDTIDFITMQAEDYGTLVLKYDVPTEEKAYLFELLDEKGNVLFTWSDTQTSVKKIDRLLPGKYSLRCVYDENRNGKWDSGFYFLKQQPEKIIYYPEYFQLRANWDLELNWKIIFD